jgi:hypothetical protein
MLFYRVGGREVDSPDEQAAAAIGEARTGGRADRRSMLDAGRVGAGTTRREIVVAASFRT